MFAINASDEDRIVRIGYRLHLMRRTRCTCDLDECDACATQFMVDMFKRLLVEYRMLHRRAGHNTLVLERIT